MEPVTHVLTGACLARTGLNRRTAYATFAMALAAEFPDIDTLWSLRGPVSGFQHHRGITHSFLGLPFEAALLLLGVVLFHRIRIRRQRRAHDPAKASPVLTQAPVRWGVLYGCLLLALGSHLLLDYTNNYGLRPFVPFQTRWYAASIVFIFDPWIFLFLLVGLVAPSLFGLIDREVGARRKPFRGAGWARAALLAVVAFWLIRANQHGKAVALADSQTLQAPAPDPGEPVAAPYMSDAIAQSDIADRPRPVLAAQRSLASPDPLSPFRWYTATDFGPAYRLGTADTRTGTLSTGLELDKPSPSQALTAAETSHLGQVYLDWSMMPLLAVSTLDAPDPALPPNARSVITFQDLRFMGSTPLLHRGGRSPLSGEVVLDAAGKPIVEGIDGRFGK